MEYGRVFEKIGQDPGVRVVVLASSFPNVFSAGIDCTCAISALSRGSNSPLRLLVTALGQLHRYDKDPARRALQIRRFTMTFQECISAAEKCPYPVIAAVHGVAFGLSIDIIAACDVRYAAENARFAIKVSLSLPYSVSQSAYALPVLLGSRRRAGSGHRDARAPAEARGEPEPGARARVHRAGLWCGRGAADGARVAGRERRARRGAHRGTRRCAYDHAQIAHCGAGDEAHIATRQGPLVICFSSVC